MNEVTTEYSLPHPLPWQKALLAQLLTQYTRGRLHHAWLLHGPEGTGKRDFALALATSRLCRERAPDGSPCGHCKSCGLIRAGSHPDLLLIEPEENGAALKIDRVRQIGDFVNRTAAYSGSARIVILAPAEALGQGAANALLKSLEEPPGDSLFLLISHVPGALLPTIRSRCQPLQMPEPDVPVTRQWLQEHATDPEQVDQALRLAPGQPLKALRLIDERVPALFSWLEETASRFVTGSTSLAELVRGCQDSDPRQVIAWLLHDLHVRATAVLAADRAGSHHAAALFPVYRKLLGIDRQLAGTGNPNRQLTLESAFLQWKQVVSQCH